MIHKLITTRQVAKMLAISVGSVNYYTNLGLFKIKDRKGNARLYDGNEIRAIFDSIRRLRKEGYSLRLIQSKMEKGYDIEHRL